MSTRKDRPHTPVTEARRRLGASTCVMPSWPHANPPSGNAPRIHSSTVQRPASPSVEITGCSTRQIAGASAPNAARKPAEPSTRAANPALAEQQDPVQDRAEVGEAEHEARRGRPARAASPGPATGAGSEPRRRPATTRPAAGTATSPRPRRRPRTGRTGVAGFGRSGAKFGRSGAVPAEHLRLVLQLASMLHQVAVLAYELGGLGRNDLDGQRLESFLPREVEDGIVVLLGLVACLLLDEDVLDRLDVLVAGGRRRRGRRESRAPRRLASSASSSRSSSSRVSSVSSTQSSPRPGIVLPGISLARVQRMNADAPAGIPDRGEESGGERAGRRGRPLRRGPGEQPGKQPGNRAGK